MKEGDLDDMDLFWIFDDVYNTLDDLLNVAPKDGEGDQEKNNTSNKKMRTDQKMNRKI